MISGMAAQLKAWVPGLQLIYPNIQKLTSNTTPFTWSADLSLEFQAMKRAIQDSIKLSPFDTTKKLYAFVDSAVTVGTAYILAQRKDENCERRGYNIIACHSTTFKKAQAQYSPFEANSLVSNEGRLLHPWCTAHNHIQRCQEHGKLHEQ